MALSPPPLSFSFFRSLDVGSGLSVKCDGCIYQVNELILHVYLRCVTISSIHLFLLRSPFGLPNPPPLDIEGLLSVDWKVATLDSVGGPDNRFIMRI